MLAWIASYPRSGNAFFRQSLFQLFGHRSAREKTRRLQPEDWVPKDTYDNTLWTILSDQEMSKHQQVFFIKSHLLPHESVNPAIYLVRDGRDALVSYAWHSLVQFQGVPKEAVTPQAFRAALYNLMVDERSPYGDWSCNVTRWLGRPKTIVIRFEDLIQTPVQCVTRAVEGLGLSRKRTGLPAPTFRELQERRPHHYRRGVVGSHQDEFPEDLEDLFWQRHGAAMKAAGYRREQSSSDARMTA